MPSFKKKMLQYRDDLYESMADVLSGLDINEVIFFPDLGHAPIIRINADSGWTAEDVAAVEARSPEILVREIDFAGAPGPEAFAQLETAGFGERLSLMTDSARESEMAASVRELLSMNGIELGDGSVWEVEVEQDNVTVRLADAPDERDEVFLDDSDVRVEFVPEASAAGMKALIGYFDSVKKEGKPFLRTLVTFGDR